MGFNLKATAAGLAKLDPKQTGELERSLRLSEDVLRHLLISPNKD